MSQLEKDLAKAQVMERYTGPLEQIINSLPNERKYYKSKQMLRGAITEILAAACEEDQGCQRKAM